MKQLSLIVLVLFLTAFVFAMAQDTDESTQSIEEQQVIHTFESLRTLEYDSEVAEQRDADELRDYLTGNILIGIWAQSSTKQYFAPSGTTWYQEEDNPQSHGTWRVRDDGKYCSVWPPSRVESCYSVSFMDDVLFWHSSKNRYPSALQIIANEDVSEASESDDVEEKSN